MSGNLEFTVERPIKNSSAKDEFKYMWLNKLDDDIWKRGCNISFEEKSNTSLDVDIYFDGGAELSFNYSLNDGIEKYKYISGSKIAFGNLNEFIYNLMEDMSNDPEKSFMSVAGDISIKVAPNTDPVIVNILSQKLTTLNLN